jgi:GMP synthase (glutamine-hydrolysing)
MQLIAQMNGGIVGKHEERTVSENEIKDQLLGKEYGRAELILQNNGGTLLRGLGQKSSEIVWMSHGDSILKLPQLESLQVIGNTRSCDVAAFEASNSHLYGVQFHPEVAHTRSGLQIFKNFCFDICNCTEDWSITNLAQDLVEEMRRTVPEDEAVIMGVSGGVDSTVASTILIEALGPKRVHCVFIDHGLLRKDEREQVLEYFHEHLKFEHFHLVDAREAFFDKLKGVTDPELKRKIIGHLFIETFDQKVEQLTEELGEGAFKLKWLGQGTIYPDRIESAEPSKNAHKIKSHHNLTLPERMKLKVIEPLKELYKDEVRRLGLKIGVPEQLISRHPFPGPGLAIRILGEIDADRVKILQEADYLFIQALHRHDQYDKVWQAFAALIPVRTVGVMGDARTYDYIITLRAVTSIGKFIFHIVNNLDGMTADWAKLPYEFLEEVSADIINRVNGVNRVLYDVSQKPPATIEYE